MLVNKVAVLFPGQGAYFAGSGADAHRSSVEARGVLDEIDEVALRFTGERVSDYVLGTDARTLDELMVEAPDLLQLAIYTTSVMTYRALCARGLQPAVLVGHSLGEIAAVVSAGAFSVADGAEIVCHRSAALREAGVIDGHMAALGTDVDRAERIIALVGDPDTVVAVENHAGQTVVSGGRDAVGVVSAVAAALGIGARKLKSPYPFHSPVLAAAATDFAGRIRDLPRRPFERDVYSPILGRRYEESDDLTAALASHLTRRVRFADALRAVYADGAGVFVESGALDALSTIARNVLAGSEHLAVAALSPTSTISSAIVSLIDAGAIVPGSAHDVLREALLPDADATVFERFWQLRGSRVAEFVKAEYLALPPNWLDANASDTRGADNKPAVAAPLEMPVARERSRTELLGELVTIYADALEYPTEVFDADTDLEAELGVDSVKQTELLGRVGAQYGLPPRPSDFKLGEHNTLGRIVDLIVAA